jgi:hypothetical protein
MSARPTEPTDEPEAVDHVMLSVLSNRGRDATVLTAEQERLLDDWVAGRLAAADVERAAALAKRNTLAAERVLERRLQQAAERGPAVPERLRARVLASHFPPKASAVGAWWRSLRRRQWLAIAGAVALASIAVVVAGPVLQRAILGGAPVQVAMVTIGDRSALFEPSDVRMRGAPQPAPTDQRFRDVDMPAGVLRDVVAQAGRPVQGDLRRQLEPYLPNAAAASGRPLKLIVDAGLRQRLDTGTGADRPVRIYDLADPRATDIARMLNAAPDGGLAYLLTTRP